MNFFHRYLFKTTLVNVFVTLGIAVCSPVSAQTAATEKNVEVILDASGSMNAKLSSGVRKIDAAKEALAKLVGEIPSEINMSFRAYGHQSHRSKQDCKDSALVVPFGKAGQNAVEIIRKSGSLKAQGYTPISYSLGLAAADMQGLTGQKTIILVSDGKETCEKDPCAIAKQLADANVDLVVHTIGFGVDAETKAELQCIAKAGKGEYFSANSTAGLVDSLQVATQKASAETEVENETIVIEIKKAEAGDVFIDNGEFVESGAQLLDAETGEKVATFYSSDGFKVTTKPGLYDVAFGSNLLFKGISITNGETTTVKPGLLKVERHKSHRILDSETGKHVSTIYDSTVMSALPPGMYDIVFGQGIEKNVKIESDKTTTIVPAILRITNFDKNDGYMTIVDRETGKEFGKYYHNDAYLALLPGLFDLKIHKTYMPIELKRGEETVVNAGGIKLTPAMNSYIYHAEDDKEAVRLWDSDEMAHLAPGKYYAVISEQKVPFSVTPGKIVEIRVK